MQLFKLTFSTFFLKINLVLFLVIGLLILISTLQVQSFDKKTLFIENRLNSIENHLEKIRGTNDEWENRRSKLRLQLNELEAKKALLASNNFIFRLLTDILIIPFIFSVCILFLNFKKGYIVTCEHFKLKRNIFGKITLIAAICIAASYYLLANEIDYFLIDDTSFFYTLFVLTFLLILFSCIINFKVGQSLWFILGILSLIPYAILILTLSVLILSGPWKFG